MKDFSCCCRPKEYRWDINNTLTLFQPFSCHQLPTLLIKQISKICWFFDISPLWLYASIFYNSTSFTMIMQILLDGLVDFLNNFWLTTVVGVNTSYLSQISPPTYWKIILLKKLVNLSSGLYFYISFLCITSTNLNFQLKLASYTWTFSFEQNRNLSAFDYLIPTHFCERGFFLKPCWMKLRRKHLLALQFQTIVIFWTLLFWAFIETTSIFPFTIFLFWRSNSLNCGDDCLIFFVEIYVLNELNLLCFNLYTFLEWQEKGQL